MKKFLMNALAIIVSCYATTVFAAPPDSPYFVGTMLGDSTVQLRSKAYVADELTVPKTYSFTANETQTLSLMVMGGYRFTDMIGIEGQITRTLTKDKVYGSIKVDNSALSELHSSMNAVGAYALFQFGGDAYFKARAGLAKSGIKLEADFANDKFSSTGFSYGVSVGQKLGKLGSVELIYMRYPEIKVDNQKFTEDFFSDPSGPYSSYTSIQRNLKCEVLMLGYVFQF